MKKYVFIVLAMICIACSKDDSPQYQDIRLSNEPLSVIKSNIEGSWELHYGEGGINASNIQYYDNFFFGTLILMIKIK